MRVIFLVVLAVIVQLPAVAAAQGVILRPGESLPLTLGVNADSAAALGALEHLAGEGPFAVRIPIAWSDPAERVGQRLEMVEQVAAAGSEVIVNLRYGLPDGFAGGEPTGAFASWVGDLAGPLAEAGVSALDITSRVNAPVPDPGSDAGQPGAILALLRGVVAAKEAAPDLDVGFSWLATGGLSHETAMLLALRAGGEDFLRSVDFVSAHLYPGSLTPGAPSGDLDAARESKRALLTLRELMPLAGLGPQVRIDVGEYGAPVNQRGTPGVFLNAGDLQWALRTEPAQARVLRGILNGVEAASIVDDANIVRALAGTLADPPGADCNRGLCWGLMRPDLSVRPSYDVVLFAQRARRV